MKIFNKAICLGLGSLLLGSVASSVNAQPTIIITNVAVLWGLSAVNPTLNRIYISGGGNGNPETQVIDGNTFSQITVATGWYSSVDLTNNNFWTANVYSGTVTVWNNNNSSLGNISLGYCPMEVSVDATHRVAWVGAQCGPGNDPLWAINADTHAIIAGPISSGGVQGSIVVNPITGRLYIDPSAGSRRVNPSTFAVTANSFGAVVAVNASANLLYAQSSSTTLQIINGAPDPEVVLTNIALPFPIGGPVGVNPALNRIYVGNGASNNIAILNATTGQSVGSFSLGAGVTSVQGVIADATRNRVYAEVVSGGGYYLYVIQDMPLLSVNMYAGLTVFAPVASTNQIQYVNMVNNTNWITLTNLVLPAAPYTIIDYGSAGQPQRFYRDVQQ